MQSLRCLRAEAMVSFPRGNLMPVCKARVEGHERDSLLEPNDEEFNWDAGCRSLCCSFQLTKAPRRPGRGNAP